jgi:hypothetical protein
MTQSGIGLLSILLLFVLLDATQAHSSMWSDAKYLKFECHENDEKSKRLNEVWPTVLERAKYIDLSRVYAGEKSARSEIILDNYRSCNEGKKKQERFVRILQFLVDESKKNRLVFLSDRLKRVARHQSLDLDEVAEYRELLKESKPSWFQKTRHRLLTAKDIDALQVKNQSSLHARKLACTDKELPILQATKDQGADGICYAYAAADMLSYRVGQLKGNSVDISPLSVTSAYFNKNPIFGRTFWSKNRDVSGEGGVIDEAIAAAVKSKDGLCSEADLPSRIHDFEFKNLNEVFEDIRGGDCSRTVNFIPRVSRDLIDQFGLDKKSNQSILKHIVRKQCENNKIDLKDLNLKTTTYSRDEGSKEDLLYLIDKEINQNGIVGISYYSSILKNPYSPAKKGRHASTIVGRRWNPKGVCEYKFRNSWGDCQGTYKLECNGGNFYVPEDVLLDSVNSIVKFQ